MEAWDISKQRIPRSFHLRPFIVLTITRVRVRVRVRVRGRGRGCLDPIPCDDSRLHTDDKYRNEAEAQRTPEEEPTHLEHSIV